MDEDQKLKSQRVRDDYLKRRALRRARDSLGPVEVVDAIAGDADGLMPVAKLNSDIAIKVHDWGAIGPVGAVDVLRLEWRYETDADYVELSEEELSLPVTEPFPITRAIKHEHFDGREGRFNFRYGVLGWNDTEMSYSEAQPITIDRTPIYGQQDPPAVEDPGPVNDTVLDAAGGVLLTIPDFVEEKKDFVKVAVVWTFKPPPADQPIIPDFSVNLPADRKLLVERRIIEALPSGDHYVAYELFDKAGNRSRPSRVRAVKVALGPLPEALASPFVPLAPDIHDNLIDLEDARTGVFVEVPRYDHHHSADQVVVTWGTDALPGVPVGVAQDPFPVEVPVSWDHLKAQYTNDPANQATPVTYKIVRGTTDFDLDPSKAISVNVNFGYGSRFDVEQSAGVGYRQSMKGLSLGADAPLPVGDGQWLMGLMAGYSQSDLDVDRGTTGEVDSYYAGAYTTWLDEHSGYYFDGVLKFNRLRNKADVAMSDGQKVDSSYDNNGVGASLEFGRHIALNDGYFIEPFGQLAGMVFESQDYTLSNGMRAEGDNTRSVLAKLGATAGRNFDAGAGRVVQPYVRAALAHEFADGNEVQVNGNAFDNDLSGSRGELGLGVAMSVSDKWQVHADFDYSNGQHIDQPWGANVGVRYSW